LFVPPGLNRVYVGLPPGAVDAARFAQGLRSRRTLAWLAVANAEMSSRGCALRRIRRRLLEVRNPDQTVVAMVAANRTFSHCLLNCARWMLKSVRRASSSEGVLGSLIERIDLASQSRQPLAARGARVVCSGDRWGGVRVQHVYSPAAEWPECHVPHDVITALVGDGCLAETWYPGMRPRTLRLPPNTVFVLPARMPVKHINFGPTEYVDVEILPEMLDAARGQSGKRLELRRVLAARDPVIFQLLIALRDELRVDNPGGRQYAESLGSAIVAHVSYKYSSSRYGLENHRGGLPPYRLKLVMEYVHANLGVDFGILELAKLVQLNVDSFIRAFRVSVGVPPHSYIVMRRIEHARALLRDRSLSIPEIAGRSGFGSESSFTRAFRREMRLSPREYRMSL